MFTDDLKKHYDVISADAVNDHIFGHFDTFLGYGRSVDIITEFGVERGISTCAWLMSEPKKLTCYDSDIGQLEARGLYEGFAKETGIDFQLIEGDTHKVEIEPTDLLFIDTTHTIDHLLRELELHAGKVRKFILLHDTNSRTWPVFARVRHYLEDKFPDWKIKEHYDNCNGLTVLERIRQPVKSIERETEMETQQSTVLLTQYAQGEVKGKKALAVAKEAARSLPPSHNRTVVLQDIARKLAGQETSNLLQVQVNTALISLIGVPGVAGGPGPAAGDGPDSGTGASSPAAPAHDLEPDRPDFNGMSYSQLQSMCKDARLSANGSKEDLIARLIDPAGHVAPPLTPDQD